MRVWVTRTEPGASRLAAVLQEHGFEVLKAPVLRIELLPSAAPAQRFELMVFVSEHAVHGAARNGGLANLPPNQAAAAIGDTACHALRRYGIEPTLPAQPSAAAIAEALLSVPRRTLIVKGEDGRNVLQNRLRTQGGSVTEWNVYRRVALTPELAEQRIEAIVAASGEGASAIADCWRNAARDYAVPLLAPSERVARHARRLGFRNVVVTLGANDLAVVRTLTQLVYTNSSRLPGRGIFKHDGS